MLLDFVLPTALSTGISPQGTAWSRFGSGPVVVLIHGVGMAQAVWAPQIKALSKTFTVVTYDLWGHGKSLKAPEHSGLDQFAQQLKDLLVFLKLDQVCVVGHSMGALVALDFALNWPEICKSVVALNAVFCRNHQQSNAVMARAKALSAGVGFSNLDDTMSRWFGNPVPPELIAARDLASQLLSQNNPLGYAAAYTVFANSDRVHETRLKQLKVPALFFTGEMDPNSTPEMSLQMAQLAPMGQALVLAQQRHMMSLTAPYEVTLAIKNMAIQQITA
jgi:pimeloyl-ACP methyl ester carboxylesterase